MSEFEEIKKIIHDFTVERDWDQFHDGKNLAIVLFVGVMELAGGYVWQ